MANDLSNPVQANPVSGDGFFEHGAGQDSLFSTVQLAQNGTATPTAAGQTIHVTPPQGAPGPVVIRVEVTPGSTVELPQPFEADATLMAREGDGNLAIKVGDVTVILQGYVDANQAAPVTIEGADNQPIDIATILASTDPTIDIQTAAGPDAGQNGQGADNSGAILAQLEGGDGLGGFEGAGAQDGTELGYRTIDASIRNDFADPLQTSATFGFSVGAISGSFGEGFLRDPAQTVPFSNASGTFFGTFLDEYRDAVEHPGQAMYAGWADFHGTGVTGGDFEEYLSQTSQVIEVDANFTGGTGDLVLTGIADGVTSNHSDLKAEFKDGGHTMFLRREEDNALVAVVHVEGPDASGHFTIETILINRLDHPGAGEGDAGKDSMDIEIQFKVYDGPAPNQQQEQPQPIEGGENNDVPEGPTSPSIDGSFKATFADDVPILEKVSYQNQHETPVRKGEAVGGSDVGLIDEDWLHGGAKDKGVDKTSNAGQHGDTGGGTCVTGCIDVNFGADGAAKTDAKGEGSKHAFVLDTAGYQLGADFGTLHSGGVQLIVLSVGPDHLTVGIADTNQQQRVEGEAGDETPALTDPIPGCTVFTLTLNQDTGHFEFDLKGPLDHSAPTDAIFGDESGVSALVADEPENTIPLAFGVKAYDDDGDWVQAAINIDVNDDVPVARDDSITVLSGSHDVILGDVITAWGEDSTAGKDSLGADGAIVIGVAAGDLTGDQTGGVGTVIQGTYGKLYMGGDGGKYTYTRDAYSDGGVDDVFTYTLKDGDGDTSTATLTIHIQNAEVSVDLPSSEAETTVYESGLPDGSNAAADSEQTDGTITITAKDGIKSLEIGGESLTLTELKDLGTTPHVIEDATGKLTLTGFNESTGELSYTYLLKDNTDANSKSSVTFDIKVTDVDDDTGTAALKIDIVDDEPTAVCETITLDQKVTTTDVQFIIDVSGSMERFSVGVNGYPDNGVGLARYSIEKMLNAHPEIQNVQFVLFDDHASHSVWMTAAQALAYVKDGDNFDSGGGYTNFDRALAEAMGAFDDARPLPQGNQNLVYFFSDGNPNEPHNDPGITDQGNGASQVSKQEWQDFINDPANHITDAFAIGIGNVTASQLAPIAYPDGPANTEPNFLTISSPNNLGALLTTLDNAIVPVVTPITGNVLDNDVSGADGFGNGKLVSLSFDTDGSGAGTDRTTLTFDSTHHSHTIDMGADRGKLVLNDDGTYSYTPPAGKADGTPFDVEYTVQDGDGDTSTAKLKIDINTRPETDLNGGAQGADNQANFIEQTPVLIAPQGTVSDDADIHAMTLKLTDRPDGNGVESLGLNAAALLLVSQNNLTVSAYNQATGVITVTGSASPAVYQAILRGIEYNNASDTPNTTDRHVTVVVNDGTFDSVIHTVDICVTPVNDAPDATINPVSFAANEDQSINLSGKIGNTLNMMIGDPDSGNDDVTVTVSVTEGKLTVEDGWTGVTVTNNNSMSVTLKGSVAEINNLLKESNGGYVKYINENNTPTHDVTLTLKVNDNGENGGGGAKFDQDTATIYVTDINDKPVTDLNGNSNGSDASASFVEDSPAVKIAPNGKISDVDSSNLTSMTVTITNVKDGSAESLAVNPALLPAGVTANYANGVLTISGPASVAIYQTILQNIVYNNSSDTPNTANRNVTVVVNDGSLNSESHTSTISVTPHNDAPTATALQSGLSVNEQASLNIAGKGLSIADVDAGSDTITVKLTVGEGALAVSTGGAGVSISGSGSGTVYISGSQSEINKVLTGTTGSMNYKDDTDTPAASTKLTMTVDDKGNNGNGGDQTATVETTITINALNDAPVACDDVIYTNAGKSSFQIAEWALLYNVTDPDTAHNKLDLVNEAAGVTAISGVSSKDTAVHTNGTDAAGYVTFTDTAGNDGSFNYKVTDNSGGSDTGHATIFQVSGSSVTGGSSDDIVIGGGGDDKLSGGSGGTDLIFGGAGDDTMIFGSGDKYDGGSGFDQVRVTTGDTNFSYDKGAFIGVEMVDIGETYDRGSSDENKFSLNAGDLVAGATGTSLGGHSIALYVIGDTNGSGHDNVDLTGFNMTAVANNLSFKDNVTDTTHFFNIYEAAGGVKVAVEAGLDVS